MSLSRFVANPRPYLAQPEAAAQWIIVALKACIHSWDPESCLRIHSDGIAGGLYSNPIAANAAVNALAQCRAMAESYAVFNRMPQHSASSWNSLILGYVENGDGEAALGSFQRMLRHGCEAEARTYVAAVMACTALASKSGDRDRRNEFLDKGIEIHARATIGDCLADTFLGNSLINFYAKCGSMVDARGVFDRMPRHDLVSWNCLIAGHGANGENDLALDLFRQVRSRSSCSSILQANARTFVAVLMSCLGLAEEEEPEQIDRDDRTGTLAKLASLEMAMEIHADAARCGVESQMCLASILLDLYAECGSLIDARRVFDKMPRHDVVSWTSLILGHVKNNESELALELFEFMRDSPGGCVPNSRTFIAALAAVASIAGNQDKQLEGGDPATKLRLLDRGMSIHAQALRCNVSSDLFLASAVVEMYANCGSMPDAQRAFDRMITHDVVSWTSLILGYAENGDADLALDLFRQMPHRGCAPDPQTYVAALVACSNAAALNTGKKIHALICRCKLENQQFVANSLVDLYSKCGAMADAEVVFSSLEPGCRNPVTWGAILTGYARQGDTSRVLDLFQSMREEGSRPNRIIFLAILTACSHAGMVERCRGLFESMQQRYGIAPDIEHYHCLIDALGRANLLDEAVAVATSMPFDANAVTWKTLLAASAKWKNIDVGKLAFEKLGGGGGGDVPCVLVYSAK